MFDWENAIALHAMQGNQASSLARGKSHGFSRVAAGTWGIYSSYNGDAHSKRENTCLIDMGMFKCYFFKK